MFFQRKAHFRLNKVAFRDEIWGVKIPPPWKSASYGRAYMRDVWFGFIYVQNGQYDRFPDTLHLGK